MSKKLCFLTITVILLTCTLQGTETRVSALGGEKNLLIDDTNVYLYPSCLGRFVERGIAEYGLYPYNDSLAYFSFFKEIGRFGNIGLVYNRLKIPEFPPTSSLTRIAQPEGVVDLLYSLTLKDVVSIGFSGGYGINGQNYDIQGTSNDITNESSVTSGRMSITYTFGLSEHFIELGGGVQNLVFSYKQGNSFTFENNNKMTTGFNGRIFYNLNDYVSVVPFFEYSVLDLSSRETSGSIATEITRITSTTEAGLGFNLIPFEENRLIVGFGYRNVVYEKSSSTFDTTVTENRIPEFFSGIESELRPWITLRVGIQKSLTIRKTDIQNGIQEEFTDKETPFTANAGFRLRFGSFEIDGLLHDDLRFTYGYFTSGKENPIFTKVSATYHF
jgi:hypothetical protein